MELKDFIKQTLSDIANAIKESQEELKDVAVINAPNNQSGKINLTAFYDRHMINFDVAVSASEENDKSAGISVLSAFSGGVSSNSTSQQSSRITFSIPVYLSRGQLQGYDKLQSPVSNNQRTSYAEPTGTVTG